MILLNQNCPSCGCDVSWLKPYDIGSGPELCCPHCDWCWGINGQRLSPNVEIPDARE